VNSFLTALKKYAMFSGRSARSEYWYFILFYFLFLIVLAFVDVFAGTISESAGLGLLSALFALAMLVPSLSVSVRRLHDTDHSGWWFLLAFIPIVGGIWLFVYMVQDSVAGVNQYGPNPKAV
jgi:uncharacterized membrane protein YhaH (DUF805 family)